ncbi:MAG: hypothetical protein U9Q34_08435 [Elusimicrobiota bacterium]|nr:hypothetical protein [Elusimicrobiota bacterium]
MIKIFISFIFLSANLAFAGNTDINEKLLETKILSSAEIVSTITYNSGENVKYGVVETKTLTSEIAKLTKKAFDDIYAIKVEEADKAVDEIIAKYPNHPFGHFGKAMTAWARFEYQQERSNTKLDDEYVKLTDKVAEIGKAWLKKHPKDENAYMCLGGIYGLRARLAVTQHRWIKAYFDGKKAVRSMRKAIKINPELYDAYLGVGLYEYYAGTLPGVIGILSKIFFISGNAQKGLDYLTLCSEKGYFNRTAAKLVLIEIYTQYKGKYSKPKLSVKWSEELMAEYPMHPLMHFVLIASLYEDGQIQKVQDEGFKYIKYIEEKRTIYTKNYLPRAYLTVATSFLAQMKFGKAEEYFLKSIDTLEDKDIAPRWAVWSIVRLGNIYDLREEREKALEQYEKAIDYGDEWGFKDDIKKYIKHPFTKKNIPCQLPPP